MRILSILVLLSGAAFGANIDGQWKTTIKTDRGGAFDEVLVLKTEGSKLTGGFTRGKETQNPLEDGRVEGDRVMFYVSMPGINGQRARCRFEGTVKGDLLEIEMTIENGRMEKTFKRAK